MSPYIFSDVIANCDGNLSGYITFFVFCDPDMCFPLILDLLLKTVEGLQLLSYLDTGVLLILLLF